MAAFPARYSGTCTKCKSGIYKGNMISWSRKERGKVYHASCVVDPIEAPVAEVVEYKKLPVLSGGGKDEDYQYETYKKVFNEMIYKIADKEQELNEHGEINDDNSSGNESAQETEGKDEKGNSAKDQKSDNKSNKQEPKSMDQGAIAVLAEALMPHLDGKLKATGNFDEAKAELDKKFAELVKELPKPKVLEIKINENKETTKVENPHKQLEELLTLISLKENVYLYGAPGTGKSTAAKQCSEALGLGFGYIALNPQTPESRILGYMDAGGTYRPSVFRDCYENGKVFCIDEMDNASAGLLTTLNSMLENGHGAFPDGVIKRNDNFVLVATGNTSGRGGNPAFPDRRAFDSAFMERFVYMEWEIDEQLERNITLAINPDATAWIEWVKSVRAYVLNSKVRLVVSPRASFKGALLLKATKMSVRTIAERAIFKGLDNDTVSRIVAAVPLIKRGNSHER